MVNGVALEEVCCLLSLTTLEMHCIWVEELND